MSNTFLLEVLTPEKQFFSGEVEAITVCCTDGQLTVLKGHAPLICGIQVGAMRMKENGKWRSAFNSEGFMEVAPERVLLFVQACEWPEQINVRRAQEARERAQRHLREQRSMMEYKHSQISLMRAMMRLRVKEEHIYHE